jgi:AcrR family transcriptional regulator
MVRPKEPWRRERLLDAAVVAMAETGPSALRVIDVAQAAGVSSGTVHYHFNDIAGVFLGVVARAFDQMYDQRLALIERESSVPRRLALLIQHGILDSPNDEMSLMYESIGLQRSTPEFAAVSASFLGRQLSLYRSVIEAGVASGDFVATCDADVIATNLLALEDAYDMYITLGVHADGPRARANMRAYAATALGVSVRDLSLDD